MEYNKNEVVELLEKAVWSVDFDNYDILEDDGHFFVRHNVIDLNDENVGYELQYGEHSDLYDLREEVYESKLMGDENEQDRLELELHERLSVEHNDVFDYDSEPSILCDGCYI